MGRRALALVVAAAGFASCSVEGPRAEGISNADRCVADFVPGTDYYPEKATVRHAERFSISYHERYKVLRATAPATNWGPELQDVVVLHRCGTPAPSLGDSLAGATVLQTPISRFATNSLASALRLRVLGLEDRIVAMPGNPFDSALAERVRSGNVARVGHSSVELERLLVDGAEALVLFTSSLQHAETVTEARDLGIGAMPLLSWSEPTYLGQAEWIKHHAALFDAEAEAEDFFDGVESRYQELARSVEGLAPVHAMWATPMESGRWWVEVGNWQDEVLRAAGGRHVFTARPGESSAVLAVERIVEVGADIDVWILGEPDPLALGVAPIVDGISAWGSGRTWHVHARTDPARDARDWSETPLLRPDLVLDDLITILHPELRPGQEPRFLARVEGKEE